MKLFVNGSAAPNGDGSQAHPFRTIQQAAAIAMPGDEVVVAPGIYPEDVSPVFAGTERKPIVYRSAEPRGAVITGADRFTNWEHYDGDVWKLTVPNVSFHGYNPYTTLVFGDWLDQNIPAHTGDVFLNGKSLYEMDSLQKVLAPEFLSSSWDREFTKHTWYTC